MEHKKVNLNKGYVLVYDFKDVKIDYFIIFFEVSNIVYHFIKEWNQKKIFLQLKLNKFSFFYLHFEKLWL